MCRLRYCVIDSSLGGASQKATALQLTHRQCFLSVACPSTKNRSKLAFHTLTHQEDDHAEFVTIPSLRKTISSFRHHVKGTYVPSSCTRELFARNITTDTPRSDRKAQYRLKSPNSSLLQRNQGFERLSTNLSKLRKSVSKPKRVTHLLPSKAKRRESELYDILHYIPNYGRVRSRLRRRILRKAWFSLRKSAKQSLMQSALYHALRDCPALAFDILRDLIHLNLHVPKHLIKDTLAHASASMLANCSRETFSSRKPVSILCTKLSEAMRNFALCRPYQIDHTLVVPFARSLNRPALKKLLQGLPPDPSKCLSLRSLCHLIKIAADRGLVAASMSILRHIHEKNPAHLHLQWACVGLIRIELKVPDDYLRRLRIRLVHEILRIGVIPGEPLRNVMIQTFMEGGDGGSAWRIFQKSIEQGIVPTRGTFFALSQRYPSHKYEDIIKIAHLARAHGCLDASVGYFLLDALRRLHVHNEMSLARPFHSALRLYVQVFDSQPLVELGFVDTDTCSAITPLASPKLMPQAKTIDLMISVFCRQFPASPQLWASYQAFITLVHNGHRLFGRVAQNPWPFEYFMAGMGRDPNFVGLCAQVLQDMLNEDGNQDLPSTKATDTKFEGEEEESARENGQGHDLTVETDAFERSGTQMKILVARPRSTTWNLLLLALVNARKLNSAEELVEMMQEEGYRPTLRTWNALIDGFSHAQNSQKVALAVEQMEKHHFVADDRTYRALTRIVNRTALFAELDKALRRRADAL